MTRCFQIIAMSSHSGRKDESNTPMSTLRKYLMVSERPLSFPAYRLIHTLQYFRSLIFVLYEFHGSIIMRVF